MPKYPYRYINKESGGEYLIGLDKKLNAEYVIETIKEGKLYPSESIPRTINDHFFQRKQEVIKLWEGMN